MLHRHAWSQRQESTWADVLAPRVACWQCTPPARPHPQHIMIHFSCVPLVFSVDISPTYKRYISNGRRCHYRRKSLFAWRISRISRNWGLRGLLLGLGGVLKVPRIPQRDSGAKEILGERSEETPGSRGPRVERGTGLPRTQMRLLILGVVLGCPHFSPMQFLGRSLKNMREISPPYRKKPRQIQRRKKCTQPPPKENLSENFSGLK